MADNASTGPAPTVPEDYTPIPRRATAAGFLAPIVGRAALREVSGYFGFPLIRKGEVVSQTIYDRAQHMGRLYELIAATERE